MSNYKIPIVPNLNLEKNDKNHYELNISFGKLKSKKTGQTCEIYNIKIDIFNEININFEINEWDYCNLFMDEISSEDGKRTFVTTNEIKYFDVECDSDNYGISLLKFHLKNHVSETKNGVFKSMVSGECYECILIKNNNEINPDEKVGVWNILECSNNSHIKFMEFESDNLKNIFLKSKNTEDYWYKSKPVKEDMEIRNYLQEKQVKSFNQLLDNESFLYHESTYCDSMNNIMENFNKLLMFYESNIVHSRFVIFESIESKKLEIRIKSKNDYKLNGRSIFKNWPDNLYDFLNSSYDSYIIVKESDIDIDLLLHYYVWIKNEQYLEVKLILCSEFLEVLNNNKNKPSDNEKGYFYDKLFQRFNLLELDTYKLLKFLQPEIFQIIENLEKEYLEKGYSTKDVTKISKRYKKEYLLRCIERYRNKIIHSGRFELTTNDLEGIMDRLINNFKQVYESDSQVDLVEKLGKDIKLKLYGADCVFNIFNQGLLFERVIEIILLKMMNVDCLLAVNYNSKSVSANLNEFNSKLYIDKFIKK